MAATATPPEFVQRDVELPVLWNRAAFQPQTYRELPDGTVEIGVRMYAGAVVRRARIFDDPFDEELSLENGALRTERLDSGRVPLLNSHHRFELDDVLGIVSSWTMLPEENAIDGVVRVSARDELKGLRRDLKDGIVTNVSIGFRVWRFRDVTTADDEVQRLLAIDWEIYELSLVPVGADAGASLRDAPELTTRTQDLGSNPCQVWQPQEPVMAQRTQQPARAPEPQSGPSAASQPTGATRSTDSTSAPTSNSGDADEPNTTRNVANAPTPSSSSSTTDPAAEARRAVAEERTRCAEIRQRLRAAQLDVDGEFGRSLIDEGVSIERAAMRILDELADADSANRTRTTVSVDGEEGEVLVRGLTDALLYRTRNVALISPDRAEVTTRLQGNPFLHRTLLEAGREFLERVSGVSARHLSKMELAGAILATRAAMPWSSQRDAAGAHSTTDFPGILANIATKALMRAYEIQRETYSAWTTAGTLPDFKTAQRIQIGQAPPLKQKIEGAEYEYGTWGEQSEPIFLANYGRIMSMTREMMVNDDLDAFMRLPRTFGSAARQLISDLVYAHVTGNTVMADGNALFSAAHGNLVTGGGNSLASAGVTALSNVRALARAQRTIDPGDGEDEGFLMNVDLPHLRVPEQLETAAQQLTSSIQAQQVGNVNPFQGAFATVAAEPRLGAASAIQFFLFADPANLDSIEVAFLQGEEGPVTEQRMGFRTDDLEIKVRMTVGTSPIEFRGAYKNEGTT